jgi:hypothetical protein
MKSFLITSLVLVLGIVVVAMLPLAPIAHQILVVLLGGNALMALSFALLVSGENN